MELLRRHSPLPESTLVPPPIVIGGKARFQGQGFTLKGRTVDIQGTELGPADALCCPTQAAQRSYRFDGRRFVPLHDAAGSTAHP